MVRGVARPSRPGNILAQILEVKMASDGKQLESLVAFVEKELLPDGFVVNSNERVYNDEGIQIAEFDIEITGKVGSTTISWLIECRDRPRHGPAPGAWIEQLVGRRTRFGFNKVTAVSTTGFTAGASEFARSQGIELREVRSLAVEEFQSWLRITEMQQIRRICDLKHASIFLDDRESADRKNAAMAVIQKANGLDPILQSSTFAEHQTLSNAFLAAIQSIPDAFAGISVEFPKQIELDVEYPNSEDYFSVVTKVGPVRVKRIGFLGELSIECLQIPVMEASEYRHTGPGSAIAQVVTFAPQSILGTNLSVELHHMNESRVTHVAIRKLPSEP